MRLLFIRNESEQLSEKKKEIFPWIFLMYQIEQFNLSLNSEHFHIIPFNSVRNNLNRTDIIGMAVMTTRRRFCFCCCCCQFFFYRFALTRFFSFNHSHYFPFFLLVFFLLLFHFNINCCSNIKIAQIVCHGWTETNNYRLLSLYVTCLLIKYTFYGYSF